METLSLPERVRCDVAGYREQVQRFCRGETHPAAFRAMRVSMGVYEHRESGRFMVRVRLGAGVALPHQLDRVAELAERYGDGIVHVTTRQDIQIHGVGLANTIDVQEALLEVGLSARGGGGNTVRNVTACPRASVCPSAMFDVTPHALEVAEHLLQLERSYSLPRKYKIAFSGCSEDCAFASVNDLGFFAHVRDGQPGFAVFAGGGLGAQPATGVRVEEFVTLDAVPLVAEAIQRVFHRLGDRSNKNRARLRFVVRQLGSEAFVAAYRSEKAALEQEGVGAPLAAVRSPSAFTTGHGGHATPAPAAPAGCLPERDPARVTLVLQLRNGRLPSGDLRLVATLARTFGVGFAVATQQQDILVLGVPRDRVADAQSVLARLSVDVVPRVPKIVACAGAATCKLGMCRSAALAEAVEASLREVDTCSGPNAIRISGCPNSCGNHTIAALGLEGRARRSQGRLVPLYEVLWGGGVGEGQARFAERLGSVPARAVPELLAEIYRRGLSASHEVRALVADYGRMPAPVPESYTFDVGESTPFSLDGRGPGECGAGVLDVVRADLEESSAALSASDCSTGSSKDQQLAQAVLASARALLPLVGVDCRSASDVFRAVRAKLIAAGWLAPSTDELLTAVESWLADPRDGLGKHTSAARELSDRTRELFRSLDASLQFQAARLGPPA